jgi:hypothetical protein
MPDYYARNQQWAAPSQDGYTTNLGDREPEFQAWVKQNKVPFDPNQRNPDYDMRGFWLGLQSGDPRARSAIDPNDSKMHFPDYWKTPYHETFSNESKWALPNAPAWNPQDQLIAPNGTVLFDDRARN